MKRWVILGVMGMVLLRCGGQRSEQESNDAQDWDRVEEARGDDTVPGDVVKDVEAPEGCIGNAVEQAQSLDGLWRFKADADGQGEDLGWTSQEQTDWEELAVPGCFTAQRADLEFYEGKAWYQRSFTVEQAGDGQRVFLVFEAVSMRSRVWLNGQELGGHLFGHTQFEFDVTKSLKAGTNLVVVLVDTQRLEMAIPDMKQVGWWNHGGIHRSVRLERRPDPFVQRLWLDSRQVSGGWDATFAGRIEGSGLDANGAVRLQLEDETESGCQVVAWAQVKPDAQGAFGAQMTGLNVQAWSPSSPKRYRLAAHIQQAGAGHTASVWSGFREVKVEGTQVLLNGERLIVRGVNRHEMDRPNGFAVPWETQLSDLVGAKALGANFIRLAHYPHSQEVVDWCDANGILTWVEIPAWQCAWQTLADAQVFASYGKPQLEEMVDQYRHHPSVIVWGVGNEFPSSRPEVREYVENAVKVVKDLDSTRLVTYASDRHEGLPLVLGDLCFDLVDIIAINEYYGWYYGKIESLGGVLDALHQKHPDKPILISEFGADGIPGWPEGETGGTGLDHSEEYQIKHLTGHLDQIFAPSREEYMAGALIWVWADFADPHRIGGEHPEAYNYVNMKGLVTEARVKKKSYSLIQSLWTPYAATP